MTGKTNGAPDSMSYSDAVRAHIPPQDAVIRPPALSQQQAQLRGQLRCMLRRHPEGVLLTQLRRSCPLLFQPEVLGPYSSTTELLRSMTDVLYMEGIGVQTRVFART